MSGGKKVIQLTEASRTNGLPLTLHQARWLYETGVADVTPGASDGTYDVAVRNVAGIITRDDLIIVISPKIPVDSLMWFITYGRTRIRLHPTKAHLQTADFVTAMAQIFATYVREAIATGLMRGYWDTEDVSPTLRGRVRLADQISRHYGRLYPLELQYQEFGTNIHENRILATAIGFLIRLLDSVHSSEPSAPRVRRELMILLTNFHGVDNLRESDSGTVARTRLNTHYWDALSLAEIILGGAGLDALPGSVGGQSFVVKMWQVFEEATVRAVGELLPHHGVQAQVSFAYVDGAPLLQLRPDIVIRDKEGIVAVMDTKYKLSEPRANDIHQLFMYAKVFELSEAHLIYATSDEPPLAERRLFIRHAGVCIKVHLLNLSDPQNTWLLQVEQMLERVLPRGA